MISSTFTPNRLSFSAKRLHLPDKYIQSFIELNPTNKAEIIEMCEPGDIVAFVGKGLKALVVKAATKSKINHVELVLTNRECMGSERIGALTVWKKELSDVFGDLSTDYKAAYICKLKPEIRKELLSKSLEFKTTLNKLAQTPFETFRNCIKLGMNCLLDFPKISENPKRLNCAGLIGSFLKEMKIIPPQTNVSLLTPRDIFDLDIFEKKIKIKT